MKYLIKSCGVLLLLLSAPAVYAEDQAVGRETYVFDKAHTNIMWFVSHIGYSDSMGQFMDYQGRIILDHDQPEQSSVKITLDTASIMTGQPEFDKHLRSADFFDVEKYPAAHFESTRVTVTGKDRATVDGLFTLLGKSRPLSLDVRFNKRGMDIEKNTPRAGFSARATVKRSLWGMKKYLGFVGDNVKIRIEAEALVTP